LIESGPAFTGALSRKTGRPKNRKRSLDTSGLHKTAHRATGHAIDEAKNHHLEKTSTGRLSNQKMKGGLLNEKTIRIVI
jgi:hypothetical protein